MRLRITGNPGIGKTFFGFYLLYRLAQKDKVVIYDDYVERSSIIFERESAYLTNNIDEYLRDPTVWYIVDGKEPKRVNAKTILIYSPKRDHYANFDNYPGATIRYMPVWNWEEIDTCNDAIYVHQRSKVKQLFLKWGGIPRFVLEKANDPVQQRKLEDAIVRCDESIFRYLGESEIPDDMSHKLFHICTNVPIRGNGSEDSEVESAEDSEVKSAEDSKVESAEEEPYYTLKTIAFGSDYIGGKVTEKLKTFISDRMRMELEVNLATGIGNPFLGTCFEQVAHRILRKGGTFNIRSLDDRKEYTMNLNQQDEILMFSAIDQIEDNKYYQPESRTFPSIDAIIASNMLFQMTIAMTHPIKMIGLKKLNDCKKLVKKGDIDFYFVVPAQLYDNYPKQNFATSAGHVAQMIPNWIKTRVQQYALKI